MNIVECRDVHRHFGAVKAIDGVNLTVTAGQIFGLLGPNGSGKTTLLNQLQGLDRPTSGTARVLGLDPIRDHAALLQRIGTQLQEATTIPRLTAREVLTTFAALYPTARGADELLAALDLTAKANTRIERLSGGQRQRLFIALALLPDPELLFFDELTSAVDPNARKAIWQILRELRAQGRTVILTTHSMEEAAELCDRVAIIDHGSIITEGTVDELIERHTNGSALHLTTDQPVEHSAILAIAGVTNVTTTPGTHETIVTGTGQFAPHVLAQLTTQGITTTTMSFVTPTLEDVFLTLTGRTLQKDG